MSCEQEKDQTLIPLNISLDLIKDAIKTLPIEDIRAVKQIIDEVLSEVEDQET